MRRWPAFGAALVWLAVLAPAAGAVSSRSQTPSTSPWAAAGFVRARGGPYLTDATGRRLQLHGVNLVAKCGGGSIDSHSPGSPCVGPATGPRLAYVLSPTARDPGRRLTPHDAATFARMGFDVVRLGVMWEGLEPGPARVGPNDPRYCSPHQAGTPYPSLGAADPYRAAALAAYLRRTDRIVSLLAAAGLRVILDMHQDLYGSAFSQADSPTPWTGDGAPPWATCTNGQAASSPLIWNGAYGDPAVEAAIHNFFTNDVSGNLQGQFARVWQAVARHYRGDPDVVGYELYNEPTDFTFGAQFDGELQCFYGGPVHEPASCQDSGSQAPPDGVIGAIQSVDPHHVIFFEPDVATNFGQVETIGITEPLRFGSLALAFHNYAPVAITLPVVAAERTRTVTLQPGGPAWIMDEFGSGRDTATTAQTVSAAGQQNLSWSYWTGLQLHDPTGSSVESLLNSHTRRPERAKAVALAVPYPAATAGTPGHEFYDPAGHVFTYTYHVARAIAAPTEIVVPAYTYTLGYQVIAHGARVVSARNAAVLLLAARPGAQTVSVTVRLR